MLTVNLPPLGFWSRARFGRNRAEQSTDLVFAGPGSQTGTATPQPSGGGGGGGGLSPSGVLIGRKSNPIVFYSKVVFADLASVTA